MAINLKTVISELQFILELSIDNPDDARLKQMVAQAKQDLVLATHAITGEDPLVGT